MNYLTPPRFPGRQRKRLLVLLLVLVVGATVAFLYVSSLPDARGPIPVYAVVKQMHWIGGPSTVADDFADVRTAGHPMMVRGGFKYFPRTDKYAGPIVTVPPVMVLGGLKKVEIVQDENGRWNLRVTLNQADRERALRLQPYGDDALFAMVVRERVVAVISFHNLSSGSFEYLGSLDKEETRRMRATFLDSAD